MRTCPNCMHCRCRADLIPGEKKFRDPNPALMNFLNSELQFAEVWCEMDMWLKQDGTAFIYTTLERMPDDSPRLKMAQSCPHYTG